MFVVTHFEAMCSNFLINLISVAVTGEIIPTKVKALKILFHDFFF